MKQRLKYLDKRVFPAVNVSFPCTSMQDKVFNLPHMKRVICAGNLPSLSREVPHRDNRKEKANTQRPAAMCKTL